MNQTSPLKTPLIVIDWEKLNTHTVHQTLQYVLKNTKAEFEKIVSHISVKLHLTESLARPDFNCIPHIRDDQSLTTWEKEKRALKYLLDIVENNNLTFELFLHNLYLVADEIKKSDKIYKKYAVNAYPWDIEHPDFIKTIQNYEFSKDLVIELTEKHKWTDQSIENLKFVQQESGVEISMDDIHPISTKDNTSMESLTKFKNAGLQVDRHKIDGKFFQEMYDVYVETWENPKGEILFHIILKHIIEEYNMKKITIEWIENEDQYKFAQLLEEKFPDIEFRYQWFYFKEKKDNS